MLALLKSPSTEARDWLSQGPASGPVLAWRRVGCGSAGWLVQAVLCLQRRLSLSCPCQQLFACLAALTAGCVREWTCLQGSLVWSPIA